jgi:class 3 adenylate cyclase/predicted ATPase
MPCSKCGFENPDGMKFCNECGSPLGGQCPNCNFENPSGSKFCGECGTPLSEHVHESLYKREQDAERRQVTVMFCDLVGSTRLSEQLDPEDLREVMRAYQGVCAEVIKRFEGYIAKYLGDGILVYFGYPKAHEDDARRAVHAGLEVVQSVRDLPLQKKQLEQPLQVRIGIHTGLVIAGEMGAGEVREQMAIVGDTPNIAARLQGLAETDTVVISKATYRLIEGYFECESTGQHTLKGISQPMEAYKVLGESGLKSHLEVATTKGLTSLVGREKEIELMLDSWEKAKEGLGQFVLLSGEAGIGKSRLVEVLKGRLVDEPHHIISARCLPYFQNSFLYPVIDYLERFLEISKADSPEKKLEKLKRGQAKMGFSTNESLQLFASLLTIPVNNDIPPLNLSPQIQKQKTQKALLKWLKNAMENSPVLFILEDMHWVDPSTLELLSLIFDDISKSRILTLLTFRPDFTHSWDSSENITEINLSRLSAKDIELMAKSVAGGKSLPREVIQQLVAKTDGVPLFVEELTKMVLESDFLKEHDENYEVTGSIPSLAIPSSIQDSLMARLDRLAPVREVAQLSSTLGREFSYEMLSEVSSMDDDTLRDSLSQLVDVEILYQQGIPPESTYIFKHALICDAAYESLLKSKRRQYHHRAAMAYEKKYKNDLMAYYPILAYHWALAAGENMDHREAAIKTINYLQLAGETALRSGAFKEAYEFLNKALDWYDSLPNSEKKLEQELKLLKNLGIASFATTGYGSKQTKEIYDRAWTLSEQIGDSPDVFPVLWGVWLGYHFSQDTEVEIQLGEKLYKIAKKEDDKELLLQAHHALWTTLMLIPDYKRSYQHLEEGRKLYSPEMHETHCFNYGGHDPGMCCHRALCLISWTTGYPDRAIKAGYEAIKLAKSHNFSLITAHMATAFIHKQRGDIEQTEKQADLIIEHANLKKLPVHALWASIFKGWILGQKGEIEEGISLIADSMEKLGYKDPGYMSMLVELYILANMPDEGLKLVEELLEIARSKNEHNYDPELLRLKGELLSLKMTAKGSIERLPKKDRANIEECLLKSLTLAKEQGAKSFELRAAMSLGRWLKNTDRAEDGKKILLNIYNWFEEGFNTKDLKDAQLVLAELS